MKYTFKDSLIDCFTSAKVGNYQFVAVVVRMDGFPEDEVIVNSYHNIDSKLEYYIKTYDDSLKHKYAEGVQIVGFTYANSFDEVQADLVD